MTRVRAVPAVFDVAKRAGVSPSTVSRVLTGQDIVTPDKRARVLKAAEELAYRPNAVAQALRLGRGRTVALLVGDVEQSVNSALTHHVQQALEEIGLDLLLFNLGHREDRLRALLRRAEGLRLRGLIIASPHRMSITDLRPLLDDLERAGISVVSVGQRLDRHGIPSIVHEEAPAASRAVAHLIAAGRTPVAFVGRITGSATGQERYRGYRRGLAAAGIPLDKELVWECSYYRYVAGYDAMSRGIARGQRPRALLAASDELALGAMAAAFDAGLKVPQDLAVVGFGGVEWGAHVRPSLTSLGADPAGIAGLVRDAFRAFEEGREPPLRSIVARPFLERQST
jgi:DNA-binding LacI/PurR family transcriptional regulator